MSNKLGLIKWSGTSWQVTGNLGLSRVRYR